MKTILVAIFTTILFACSTNSSAPSGPMQVDLPLGNNSIISYVVPQGWQSFHKNVSAEFPMQEIKIENNLDTQMLVTFVEPINDSSMYENYNSPDYIKAFHAETFKPMLEQSVEGDSYKIEDVRTANLHGYKTVLTDKNHTGAMPSSSDFKYVMRYTMLFNNDESRTFANVSIFSSSQDSAAVQAMVGVLNSMSIANKQN